MTVRSFDEIYRQRYETFRHLDKLRWQMLQIGVAASSVVFAVGGADSIQTSMWWTWMVAGLILLMSGIAMHRIGGGIAANGVYLAEAATEIGDYGIPDPKDGLSRVGTWIALTLIGSGLISMGIALFKL